MRDEIKGIWLEKQILRNLIIDSGWMSPSALDSGLDRATRDPQNICDMNNTFAQSDQMLAEIGIEEWLEVFDRMYPQNE